MHDINIADLERRVTRLEEAQRANIVKEVVTKQDLDECQKLLLAWYRR